MPDRTLIIGDVHGCLDELQELLERAGYDATRDRLVMVGDLVDRGPKSAQTVKFVRALDEAGQVVCLVGNHDDKYVRYRRWLERTGGDVARIKMRFPESKQVVFRQLSAADLDWLAARPDHHLGEGFVAVHAGICPRRHRNPEDLENPDYRERLLRLRWIDAEGKMVGDPSGPPTGATHWAESYDGRFGLALYGHVAAEDGLVQRWPNALGIDTGCCFGGRLTGVSWIDGAVQETVQVQAHRAYAPWYPVED